MGFTDRHLKQVMSNKICSGVSVFLNLFTPINLYGMFQIKAWTIPLYLLKFERVKINNNVVFLFTHYG